MPEYMGGDVVLNLHLCWSMTETKLLAARACMGWRFHGHAMVRDGHVDFRGACWRDLRSGALLRFDIDYVGGPDNS